MKGINRKGQSGRSASNKSIQEIVKKNSKDGLSDDLPVESKYLLPEEEAKQFEGDVTVLTHDQRENPVDVPEKLRLEEKEEAEEEEPSENELFNDDAHMQGSDWHVFDNNPEGSGNAFADDGAKKRKKDSDSDVIVFDTDVIKQKIKRLFGKKEKQSAEKDSKKNKETDSKTKEKTEEKQNDKPTAKKKKAPKRVSTGKLILNFVLKVGAVVLGVWALFHFVLGITINYGNHMHPGIDDGELCVSLKLEKPVLNGVVLYELDGKTRVGRVVGLYGSTIDISELGELKINGVTAAEDIFYATFRAENSDISYPFEVKDGTAFILNDHREDTYDSRTFGAVSLDSVKGPVIFSFRRRGF